MYACCCCELEHAGVCLNACTVHFRNAFLFVSSSVLFTETHASGSTILLLLASSFRLLSANAFDLMWQDSCQGCVQWIQMFWTLKMKSWILKKLYLFDNLYIRRGEFTWKFQIIPLIIMSDKDQKSSLDTNGNNEISVIMMDMNWVKAVFSLRSSCIYWYVCCASQCVRVSKRQRQHSGVSMCVCISVQVAASERVYVIVHNRKWERNSNRWLKNLAAWKFLNCMSQCLWIEKQRKGNQTESGVEWVFFCSETPGHVLLVAPWMPFY